MQYNEDGLFEDLLAELPSPRGLTPRDDAAPLSPTSALAAVSLPMSPLRCPSAVGKTGRARKASKAIQEEQQDHWDEEEAEAEEEEGEEEGEERAPSPELTPSARKRLKRIETQRSYRKRMDRFVPGLQCALALRRACGERIADRTQNGRAGPPSCTPSSPACGASSRTRGGTSTLGVRRCPSCAGRRRAARR